MQESEWEDEVVWGDGEGREGEGNTDTVEP